MKGRFVGLFSRRSAQQGSKKSTRAEQRAEQAAADQALEDWMAVRKGVEVFVEPKTTVTGTTMLIVAHDGEFTRRPVADEHAAAAFARAHTLPIYDAAVVGYPQRMRDYTRKQTILRKRALRDKQ